MNQRRIAALLLGIVLCPAAVGTDATDAKTALAFELMQIVHWEKTVQGMQEQLRVSMEKQLEPLAKCDAAQPVVKEFGGDLAGVVTRELGSDEFRVDVAAVYAETFSEDELHEIIEFYKSPLGAKLLERMPQLMQKSMQISQDRVRSMMPDIQKMSEEYGERVVQACPAGKAK